MGVALFPVGHYTGLRTAGDGAPVHTVRIGWQQHRLAEDAFGTWVLAHGRRETGKGIWGEAEIVDQTRQAGIGSGPEHLRQLAALGLIAAPDDGERFVRTYRMGVLYVGLGNTAECPDEFVVGLPGLGTAAVLDPGSYELWQWGSIAPTLWQTCELRAAAIAQTGKAVDVVGDVLGDLRYLLAHGCAYLDVAAAS